MGLTHFPNGVSSFGVPVMGGGGRVPFTTGTYFFVDSVTGNNANDGLDPDHPFATIDYAVAQCTANKNDVIIVMPNHTEDIASAGGIDLDIAGISVIGLGNGNDRPLITYSTTLSEMDIDAEGIYIENIYFDLTADDAVPIGVDVNEKYFTMNNCEFLMADGTGQADIGIDVGTSGANCRILNTTFISPDAGAESAINISAATANLEVDNCHFDGDFSNAALYCTSGIALTHAKITHNYIRNDSAAKAGINMGASATSQGVVAYNVIDVADSTGHALQLTNLSGLGWFENYATESSLAESGVLVPTAYGT